MAIDMQNVKHVAVHLSSEEEKNDVRTQKRN
jgi:hypothetical protein